MLPTSRSTTFQLIDLEASVPGVRQLLCDTKAMALRDKCSEANGWFTHAGLSKAQVRMCPCSSCVFT